MKVYDLLTFKYVFMQLKKIAFYEMYSTQAAIYEGPTSADSDRLYHVACATNYAHWVKGSARPQWTFDVRNYEFVAPRDLYDTEELALDFVNKMLLDVFEREYPGVKKMYEDAINRLATMEQVDETMEVIEEHLNNKS